MICLYLQHLSNEKNFSLSGALKLDNESFMRLVRQKNPTSIPAAIKDGTKSYAYIQKGPFVQFLAWTRV